MSFQVTSSNACNLQDLQCMKLEQLALVVLLATPVMMVFAPKLSLVIALNNRY